MLACGPLHARASARAAAAAQAGIQPDAARHPWPRSSVRVSRLPPILVIAAGRNLARRRRIRETTSPGMPALAPRKP